MRERRKNEKANRENLDWFDPVVGKEKMHDKFVYLLDPSYSSEKNFLSTWIKDFHIKDGVQKTIKQFQTTFHSQFWEVYLNKIIVESGGVIDKNVKSPDFYVKCGVIPYALEAVVANISDSGLPEVNRQLKDVCGANDLPKIIDESIVRIISSIRTKSIKYMNSYSKLVSVRDVPFVIAVGDFSQINYGQAGYYSPLAVLYNAYYDFNDELNLKILCDDSFGKEYKFMSSIKNVNGVDLHLGLFRNNEYRHISAIVYSCTLTLGKLTSLCVEHSPYDKFILIEREDFRIIRYSGSSPDEFLCDGVFVFHNPFSENPFPKECLNGKGITHVYWDEEENLIKFDCNTGLPLTRRIVGARGMEEELIDDFGDFKFIKVIKNQ